MALVLGLPFPFSAGQSAATEVKPAAAPAKEAAALPSPQELVGRMQAAQADLRSLGAEFEQVSRVKLFKQELRSQGRLLFLREQPAGARDAGPSRLRWEYLRPDPSTLLLVGDKARLRMGNRPPQDFDTGKDANLRAIFVQLKLWLGLSGTATAGDGGKAAAAELAVDYALSSAGDKARPVLVLSPKPESILGKAFSRVELSLSPKNSQLEKLLLVEQSGDEKEISFTRIERNTALPKGAFDL
jgi:outer membrane lipoprotein-sorting protein